MQTNSELPRSTAQKAIRPEMTVRQVAADFPASQEVFRRYGEHERTIVRFGHLEPLSHFARRQNVPLETLLSELAVATGAEIDRSNRAGERIHHAFLLSSLGLTLTFGAGWGAWLLWRIGMRNDFDAVPAAYVIAHGETQLWGFIALFIMGISFGTVLKSAARGLAGLWFCRSLVLLALLGAGGTMLWAVFPESFVSIGTISSAFLLLMALGFWALQIGLLWTKWRETWARAILMSGLWLTVWAVILMWYRWNAGSSGPGVYSSAQRQLLIDISVFGFTMNSIYGSGQRLFPGLLRIGVPRRWAIELAFWLHNAGTLFVCLVAGIGIGNLGMIAGCGLLVSGAAMFAVGHRGFIGRQRTSYGDEKGHAALDLYPPLAFFWLLTALTLMTGGALYETASGALLPHAYTGAVRHALTVGFMTTLILGVGQRIVPVLDHTVLAMPRLTLPILILIGLGNLLRVGSELAILVTQGAYRIMPFSAVLEWTALLLFTVSLTAVMFHHDPLLKSGRVTRRSSLAVLLAEHPWIEDRLCPTGTYYVERTRSVPRELTINTFAHRERRDAAELVSTINAWLTSSPSADPRCVVSARNSQPLESETRPQ